MAKISLAGFKDPVRRPRYIIWTGVVVLLLVAFVVVALGVTSTYWFCANVCHKVQDDAISAYNRSAHSEISCLACHMPVNANPVIFLIHKAEAGILGGIHTVTNNFENPLNAESIVALEMPEKQCLQCHSKNRVVTPSPGIIIDHEIHSENGVQCTLCHNRTAHNESGDWTTVTKDPKTGEPAVKHANFMTMTACFRCHGLEDGAAAPGACAKCHPADFELKPESHLEKDFYPKGHAEMAKEAMAEVAAAEAKAAGEGEEGSSEEATASGETTEGEQSSLGVAKAYASEGEGEGEEMNWGEEIPSVEEVNYCSTCHQTSFCSNCHGMDMPHSEEFKTKTHPELVATKLDKCDLCHNIKKTNYLFCNNCHHGSASNWQYDPKVAWQTQHAKAVVKNGIDGCLEKCHEKKFCLDCHNKLKPVPSSHAAKDWLRKPAEKLGVHAESFKSQPTSCEICHGANMPNKNAFCKKCHVLDMPHTEDFKSYHAKTGKDEPQVCANCHTFKELCSNCHHEGASNTVPWVQVHGGIVNDKGAASCFEKCHKQDFCVKCHTSRKVVPASHKAKNWTYRQALDKPAGHPAAYNKANDSCTYCHGSGTPAENKFCTGCHVLAMPHPADFKDTHKDQFASKKLSKATCTKCHSQVFCDKCHHEYTGKEAWVTYHDAVVRDKGAASCLESCHSEVFCSNCHVRRAAEILGN